MTDKDKIEIYERLFHKIQMCAGVSMDNQKMKEIISLICDWSYAHRAGNGMLTDKEQNAIICNSVERMKTI